MDDLRLQVPAGELQEAVPDRKLNILQIADKLTSGERRQEYGDIHRSYNFLASAWSLIIGHPVSAKQVGLCMIIFKVGRELASHKLDNLVDIAGYARNLEMYYDEPCQYPSD